MSVTGMTTGRLEAFSDGVLAIIITIMVLELKVPHVDSIQAIYPLLPVFLSYLLSFIYVGIYWNNHHHLLHACKTVSGGAMWANLHLLFWLSLIPFTTGWMGENHFAATPAFFYGLVLLMAALAYWILQTVLIRSQPGSAALKKMLGNDWKGKLPPFFYTAAMIASFWEPMVSLGLYVLVALVWTIPDRRFERPS